MVDRVLAVPGSLAAAVECNGGAAPRVLCTTGSRRRGESVRLLVDLEPSAGIFTLMRIQDDAERLLDVDVEVLDAARAGPDRLRASVPL